MTLTTEQLRARAESLGLDFFIERRAGVWVKEWLNNGCTSATAEEVMMWSMLADREAQPAGFYTTVSGRKGVVWHNGAPEDDTAIYTAPPAPAVPDALEKMRSIVADPRALPRRKEWISGQQYSYVLLENVEAMIEDACRAAMLKGDSK